MTDTQVVPRDAGPDRDRRPGGEHGSWEQRHIRVTFWLERALREEVRQAAKATATSITQFVAQALRRAVDEVR